MLTRQHNFLVFGSPQSGSKHPTEAAEMATFFNMLPHEYKAIALHIRNEGKRSGRQMQSQKAQGGFVKGASDIIIPGAPTFVCEMKSLSKSSRVSGDQIKYLNSAAYVGAFACLAYGHKGAWEAFEAWMTLAGR